MATISTEETIDRTSCLLTCEYASLDSIFDKPWSQCKGNTEYEYETRYEPYLELLGSLLPYSESESTDSDSPSDYRNIANEVYILYGHPYIHLGPEICSSKNREKQEEESNKSKNPKSAVGDQCETGDDEHQRSDLDGEGETDYETSKCDEYVEFIMFELFS